MWGNTGTLWGLCNKFLHLWLGKCGDTVQLRGDWKRLIVRSHTERHKVHSFSSPILFLLPLCRAGTRDGLFHSRPMQKGLVNAREKKRNIAPPLPSHLTHGLLGPVFSFIVAINMVDRAGCNCLLVSVPLFEVWKGFERSPTMGNGE